MGLSFSTLLQEGATGLGLTLDREAIARLRVYFDELQRWSKKINLIARGSSDEVIVENHFLDSLTLLPLLEGAGGHLMDVGTGAGFPGLVCGAANPDLQLTLVEPRLKRVSFLRHIIRTLQLKNVTVVDSRIEELVHTSQDTHYSHITSRAVTDIHSFLELVHPFLQPGTEVICMKGAKWQEEVQGLDDVLARNGLVVLGQELFQLPFSKATRAILLYGTSERKSGDEKR